MFNQMNFLLGFMLARDLEDNRDKLLAGLVAAQFPAKNLLGPVLVKPTVVDKAVEAQEARAQLDGLARAVCTALAGSGDATDRLEKIEKIPRIAIMRQNQ